MTVLTSFPCNACGECCRRVDKSEYTRFLDRGDGTCRHFNEDSKLCQIYHSRPLVCRVEDYYRKHLREKYEWQDFIQINIAICKSLQEEK